MPKQAPTFGRLAAMVLFALSCFGLLLYLWISFGGTTPLKPQGYRVQAAFPEATQLSIEADVRVAGVKVGRVRDKEQDPAEPNRTVATLEIDARYAPVARDARAVLRQKTLLGETYVELRLGSQNGPRLAEDERLDSGSIPETAQLDEILNTFDPMTRAAFRTWQRELGTGIGERGADLNDAIGNLPGFVTETGDLLDVLDEQRASLRGLVRNTGVVFRSLSQREGQLQNLVRNSETVFGAIGEQREAFAQTWRILPTFLDESRATFDRLETFARDTDPLLVDLEPAIRDLGPTLRSVGDFAPDLRRFFERLDPLITASQRGLPATREILDQLRPFTEQLGPWLTQLNPLVDWISQQQQTLVDMFANLGVATAAKTGSGDPQATGHYLRQVGPTGVETAAIHRTRLSSNRGNAYINPMAIGDRAGQENGIIGSYDCVNSGGEKEAGGLPSTPPCVVQPALPYRDGLDRFPKVTATPTP